MCKSVDQLNWFKIGVKWRSERPRSLWHSGHFTTELRTTQLLELWSSEWPEISNSSCIISSQRNTHDQQ